MIIDKSIDNDDHKFVIIALGNIFT